jgi:LL-H family phage holin
MENIINIDITEIIGAIITLIGIVITAFVIPYIKTKTNDAQYTLLAAMVKSAVYFAESYFNTSYGQGKEKSDYVLKYVQEKCKSIGITFNENDVKQLIEEAWFSLTNGVSDSSLIEDVAGAEVSE